MAAYFFDTSALVKRYQAERGTHAVDTMFAETGATLLISRLGLVETTSAFALKVRTGELPQPDYTLARKRLYGDVKTRQVSVVRMLVRHYLEAEQLIDRYGFQFRLRTLDALQLGVALDCHRRQRGDTFVCADKTLCEIAILEGLNTVNPLTM